MKIGYARVSTQDQNLGRQVADLQKYGCDTVYQEKITGAKSKRPELDRMLDNLNHGDIVVVHKLDRLGRSLAHLVSLVALFKEKGVDFISLNDNFNTTTSQGKLIFNIMASIAEFERDLISERTINGLAFLRSQGVKLGPPTIDREKVDAIKNMHLSGLKPSEISRMLNLSRDTVVKYIKAN